MQCRLTHPNRVAYLEGFLKPCPLLFLAQTLRDNNREFWKQKTRNRLTSHFALPSSPPKTNCHFAFTFPTALSSGVNELTPRMPLRRHGAVDCKAGEAIFIISFRMMLHRPNTVREERNKSERIPWPSIIPYLGARVLEYSVRVRIRTIVRSVVQSSESSSTPPLRLARPKLAGEACQPAPRP